MEQSRLSMALSEVIKYAACLSHGPEPHPIFHNIFVRYSILEVRSARGLAQGWNGISMSHTSNKKNQKCSSNIPTCDPTF